MQYPGCIFHGAAVSTPAASLRAAGVLHWAASKGEGARRAFFFPNPLNLLQLPKFTFFCDFCVTMDGLIFHSHGIIHGRGHLKGQKAQETSHFSEGEEKLCCCPMEMGTWLTKLITSLILYQIHIDARVLLVLS